MKLHEDMPVMNFLEIPGESSEKVELLSGNEVLELISSKLFLEEWDKLYHQCPWATVYQRKEFVTTWYKIYHKVNLPIVVTATYGEQLTGLLTLAINEKGLIVGAGSNQAEYHTWLSQEGDGESFIKKALLQVRKKFPGMDISFRFVQDLTPLEWARTDPAWKNRCVLKSYDHPLIATNEVVIAPRRNKINRLKKQGELRFQRIVDSQDFYSIFDEIAAQYDFRKATMFNWTPFQESPLRKQFLLALFDTGLLHATVLKLNNKIIASNVGTMGNKWVHLQGINTHSPLYFKHSPGILHLQFLSKLLADEGFEIFDLTPGDNSYKEMLANKQVVAHELIVTGSRSSYFKRMMNKKTHEYILKNKNDIFDSLGKIGINPDNTKKNLKTAIHRYRITKERIKILRKTGVKSFLKALTNNTGKRRKLNMYKMGLQPGDLNVISINQDNLADLLRYEPEGDRITKWEFLRNAMKKFESGYHVYTVAANTQLLCSAWIKIQCERSTEAITQTEEVFILHDLYCHKAYKDNLAHFITSAVSRVVADFNTNNVYATADAKDVVLCKILETISIKPDIN